MEQEFDGDRAPNNLRVQFFNSILAVSNFAISTSLAPSAEAGTVVGAGLSQDSQPGLGSSLIGRPRLNLRLIVVEQPFDGDCIVQALILSDIYCIAVSYTEPRSVVQIVRLQSRPVPVSSLAIVQGIRILTPSYQNAATQISFLNLFRYVRANFVLVFYANT